MERFVFFVTFLTLTAWAGSDLPVKSKGKVWVHITSAESNSPWKAAAIENAVRQNLSRSDRLSIDESFNLKATECALSDIPCITRKAANQNVDVVVLGELKQNKLKLESYETVNRSRIKSVQVHLGEQVSLTEFRHRIFRLVKPFVELGGLLDQKTATPRPASREPQTDLGITRLVLQLAIACVMIFMFLIPRAFVRMIARSYRVTLAEGGKGRKISIITSLGLPTLWFMATYPGHYAELMPPSLAEALPWAKYISGGAAWATLLVLLQRFAFPPLQTLERVNYFTISPLLRAWTFVSTVKTALFALAMTPFAFAAVQLSLLASFDLATAYILWVPIAILIGTLWYLLWIESFTLFIDTQLVENGANSANRWHGEIKKYYRGYLNRLGVSLDEKIGEQALFLPAKEERILSYGGGLIRPRIAVSSWMLIYAMGSLPRRDSEDGLAPGFSDYTSGIIFPQRKRKADSSEIETWFAPDIWRARFVRLFSGKKAKIEPQGSFTGRKFNLHNATLLGYIVPATRNESAPLIANSREDFEAVSQLMTEHYSKFAKDPDEQELDDTDPTDKDFLFGALLREQGVLEHRDQLIHTFYLGLAYGYKAFPDFFINVMDMIRNFYDVRFSRYPNMMADSFAALNGGRNHLIQCIYYLLSDRKRPLTARADSGTLFATSKQILETVDGMPRNSEDKKRYQATLRNRIDWLAGLFFGLAQPPRRRLRGIIGFGTVLVVWGVLNYFIQQSIYYHRTYVARMERVKAQIEEKQNGGE